ncbi:putative membrane protein [Oxalobacteraceae bacterium GrIS 2.11]
MSMLILGIIIFFGVHSIQIVASDWRTAQVQRIGLMPWKGAYSLLSLTGFALIIWGFSIERAAPVFLWMPPHWTHHAAALLMLFAFIFLVATYVPGNRIKATVGHPMLLAVKIWAVAHLLANGRLADVILFGAFLIWAAAGYSVLRRRDRAANVTYANLGIQRNALVIVLGIILFVLFAHFAHQWLFGVRPL